MAGHAVEADRGGAADLALGEPAPEGRPALRGVLHLVAFLVVLVVGTLLVRAAPTDLARALSCVYVVTLAAMFGTSAALHRGHWSTTARRRMRRADHAAIFLCIAGAYSAVIGLSLPKSDAIIVLVVVWAGAAIGIAMRLLWLDAPRVVVALPYVIVGWAAIGAAPELVAHLGVAGFLLLLGGGFCYSAGAVIYALRRPSLAPRVFGFHELFHAATIAGAACHLCLVAFFIFPALPGLAQR